MYLWKPALVSADVIPDCLPGERFKQSREHGMHALRHYYASVLLDAGENIRALSEYLGHSDPGFTLRTYTRCQDRARKAIEAAFGPVPRAATVRCPSRCDGQQKRPSAVPPRDTADGPQTAQVRGEPL
ncbi:tyrosine-type recombinase/integrase [Streptomyces anulatus]|uniref:tyrosine-type recombinase/integrase n=1 Tax=Streptomyces anulatus TaxID=1892 RepID=UPI003695F142